jgi:hypothetical protein
MWISDVACVLLECRVCVGARLITKDDTSNGGRETDDSTCGAVVVMSYYTI